MASNGLSRWVMSMTAKVSSTGWKQIFAMARGTQWKRFSSSVPGAPLWMMTGRSCMKLRTTAAFRGTAEFALELSQQGSACLATLRHVWPDCVLDWLSEEAAKAKFSPLSPSFSEFHWQGKELRLRLSLPAFLQSYVANLVTAGVRLIPLGQTDGQLAVAEVEQAVLATSKHAENATIDDLGSAAFMVDLASMAHERQYTRLFRS